MSELDWEKAKKHIQEARMNYTEIGVPGLAALTITINPLFVRLEKGERTQELFDEIMALE